MAPWQLGETRASSAAAGKVRGAGSRAGCGHPQPCGPARPDLAGSKSDGKPPGGGGRSPVSQERCDFRLLYGRERQLVVAGVCPRVAVSLRSGSGGRQDNRCAVSGASLSLEPAAGREETRKNT